MDQAIIGIISAVGVVLVEKIADLIAHKMKRREQIEDKKDGVMAEIKKLQGDMKRIERGISDAAARERRIRILRFEDEIAHNIIHSKDHFDQILEDIEMYRNYCTSNKDFHNGIGGRAMNRIEEVYEKCRKDNNFL